MYTPGRRSRTHSFLAAASLAVACASQSSPEARQPTPVDLNAPPTSHSDAHASRGDLLRGESVRYARMEDLLVARVPALEVNPIAGGRFTLRVRGYSAFPNAEPLIVIDGERYLKNGAEMLASLAPREVKRIEVLKYAASIAAFASVRTSAVVVVTTWRH